MPTAQDTITSAHEFGELDTRIKSLPQELQDEMFQHYLDGVREGPLTIIVDRAYKPPLQLQISRESRARGSKLYYQRPRIFQVFYEDRLAFGMVTEWLAALSTSDLETIDDIDLVDLDSVARGRDDRVGTQITVALTFLRAGVLILTCRKTG